MSAIPPSVRRCPETRAHYAHEWYDSAFRVNCPGGPSEVKHDCAYDTPGAGACATCLGEAGAR